MGTKDETQEIFEDARMAITEAYLKTCDSDTVLKTLGIIYQDKQTQYAWLNAPNLLLRGETPLDVMWMTHPKNGAQRVLDIIEAQL